MLDIIEVLLLLGLGYLLYAQRSEHAPALFAKQHRVILDSCALIDGRITEIMRTGFVISELVIPQFIVNELQLLADGNDSHKRERARYGLDIAHELQDSAPVRVIIDRTVFDNIQATDDKLVALAKKMRAQLYTTDYNLAKVAAVEGVRVLNVNELSQSLRPITLPGETLTIKVVQKGSNRDQGVGYLEDGTMIVIEGGARYVGRQVPVNVTRMHQTVAGKMVFGQIKESRQESHRPAQQQHAPAAAEAPTPNNSHAARAPQPRMRHHAAAPVAKPVVTSPSTRLRSRLRTATGK